jgi:hypothetical protein
MTEKQRFTSKITKEYYSERISRFLVLIMIIVLVFFIFLLYSADQESFSELILSRYPFGIGILACLVVFHFRVKYFVYQIDITTENIILCRLVINKEEVIKIDYENLEVQVIELVRRNSPKAACYELRFLTNGKKYSLNENNEWSFKQIHQIISELENVRIQQPFRVDGFHFKKDISERI